MMISLGTMAKLAKGGLGPDEIAEVLAAVGIELETREVPVAKDTFVPLAESASLPRSKFIELRGRMKDGSQLHALVVLHQESKFSS